VARLKPKTILHLFSRPKSFFQKKHKNIQRRIVGLLGEFGCRCIPFNRQRLLFNNQILQPDTSPVYWIAGVGSHCQIHLVENNPNENNYRSIAQIEYDD
jgi:hypothetical protein